jgi:hypothetical protein
MRGSLFHIITFTGLSTFQEENAELPLQLQKAFPLIMLTCLPLFQ